MAINRPLLYEGDEPYIFVSYSHRDMDRVLPIIQRLNEEGFRIWYDVGIDPGTEWPESIAQHLGGSKVCLAFISKNSIESRNCRREIHYALSKNLGFLSVVLEPCEMSPGLELQLTAYQSLISYTYPSMDWFIDQLTRVGILQPCRSKGKPPVDDSTVKKETGSVPEQKRDTPIVQNTANAVPQAEPKKKRPLKYGLAGAAVLLIIIGLFTVKLFGRKDAANAGAAVAADPKSSETAMTTSTDLPTATEAAAEAQIPNEITWNLENGILTLRGSGRMDKCGMIGELVPWYDQRETITAVVIEEGITQIGERAFSDYSALKTVSFPEGLLEIGNDSFSGCEGLNEIALPDSLKRIGICSFVGTCFPTVSIPKNVNYIGSGVFMFNSSLSEIQVDNGNSQYCSVDGVLFNKDLTEIISYPGGRKNNSYTIPDGVQKITNDCFGGCFNLYEVIMPDSLISIGDGAFQLCNLNQVNLPGNLESIGQAAFYAAPFSTITIPASVQSISDRAFPGCSRLKSIIVEEGSPCFSSENGVLFNAKKTILLCYPGGKKDAEYMVPDGVETILPGAFSTCFSLKKVTMPESLLQIGECSFESCDNLMEAVIRGRVASIEVGTFNNCSNLMSVTIPASVKIIGNDAFVNCPRLATVYFQGSNDQWKAIFVEDGNEQLTRAQIVYGVK